MGANKPSDLTKIGHDVLNTAQSATTGLITAQLGDVVTEDATSNEAEWYFPPGVVARPRKPDAKQKAAQVVAITRSGNDAIVGCRDDRIKDIIGQLDDGETAVFASDASGGVTFWRKDGSIKAQNGNGSIELKADGSVLVGGDDAVPLVKADAISQLQTLITNWTPVSNDGGAALKAILVDWLVANFSTSKAKGT